MAQVHWTTAVDGYFNTPTAWSTGAIPGIGDDAILDAPGSPYRVVERYNDTVNSLQTAANATLLIEDQFFQVVDGTGSGANAGTIDVQLGKFVVSGSINNTGKILTSRTIIDIRSNVFLFGGGYIGGGYFREPSDDNFTVTNMDNSISQMDFRVNLVNDVQGKLTNVSTIGKVSNSGNGVDVSVVGVLDNSGSIHDTNPNDEIRGTIDNVGTIIGSYIVGVLDNKGLLSHAIVSAKVTNFGAIADSTVAGTITNSGTITGSTLSGPIANTGTIANGAINTSFNSSGLVEATAGATLSLSGGTANDVAGGTILGDGGRITIGGETIIGGSLATQAGGVLTLDGAATPETLIGPITIAPGSTVNLAGTLVELGELTATGAATLRIDSPGAYLVGKGGVTLSGGARLSGQTAATVLTNVDTTLAGVGQIGNGRLTLVNQAGGVVDANAPGYLLVNTAAATLANAGLLTAGNGGVLVLASQTLDQSNGGTIAARSGGRVNLQGVDVIGGTVSAPGGGVVVATPAGATLDGTASAVTVAGVVKLLDGTHLTLEGTIDITGELSLYGHSTTTTLIVGAAGATLTGGGLVILRNDAVNAITGAAPTATLTNADQIIGGGRLGDGVLTLVNQAAGFINGDSAAVALVIDTGANTIQNAGQISAASGGSAEVESAIANTGRIVAASGGTLTLDGAVSGPGLVRINGGTMNFARAFDGAVTFAGPTGVLELAQSQAYLTGVITGFSTGGGTSLDLGDIAFTQGATTASFAGTAAGGVLTVSDGTHAANLKLAGDYTASTFTTSSDGHGGTTVVDPTAPAHRFVAAMAAFGAHAAAPVALTPAGPEVLATPYLAGARVARAFIA